MPYKDPETKKENSKEYYERNKEEILKKQKEYYLNNKQRNKERNKEYSKTYKRNKEKKREKAKEYYTKNKEKILEKYRAYAKHKRENDLCYKLKKNIARRIRSSIKNKSNSTLELLGCSIEELIQYIENKFQEGMTWDNYGLYGWHIDHIRPCASFNLLLEEEQNQCFHYTNLQPLWAEENLSKSSKYDLSTLQNVVLEDQVKLSLPLP